MNVIEGKGHRRARSGRSSKRSSRSDTVDNDPVSQRASRNEDGKAPSNAWKFSLYVLMFASERKARKTRQKAGLRTKQLNNANEGTVPGSGGSISVLEGSPREVGYGYECIHADVAAPHPRYGAPSKSHHQNMGLSPMKPGISECVGVQYQGATGDDEIQENIERLRVSNTPPLPPHGENTTMKGVSPRHRWGRTPLPKIGDEAPPPTPCTPPLQRRAAVRRRRVQASDTAITKPLDLGELATIERLPSPNTASKVIDNSFDVSPITSRDSICWDSPNMAATVTSISQQNKTLPLHYRLPLTPTGASPVWGASGPSTTSLPRAQTFPLPQSSSSLSVPNSPVFHTLNLAYHSGTPNLALQDSNRRTHTDPASYSHNSLGVYTYRASSASPMVHDHDPQLRAIKQSITLQKSMDIAPPHRGDLGRDATRHASPGLAYSGPIPDLPGAAVADGDPQSHPRKPPKGGKIVKFRCVVCIGKFRVSMMIQAPNCMHFLCNTCVKGNLLWSSIF